MSNGLSFLRVLLAVPIVLLILSDDPADRLTAVALIVVAIGTDFLDGLLARKLNQISDVGKVIDPLADKLGIGAVALALGIKGLIPVWFLVAVLVRDFLIFAGGFYMQRARGIILQSTMVGKWAAASLAFLILGIVLGLSPLQTAYQVLFALSAALLAVSFGFYVRRFVLLLNTQTH